MILDSYDSRTKAQIKAQEAMELRRSAVELAVRARPVQGGAATGADVVTEATVIELYLRAGIVPKKPKRP